MDPNKPSMRLFPRDDTVNYLGPKPSDSHYDVSLQPVIPGQELFDQYKQDYVPQLSLDDSSYFYLYISGQVEYSVFPDSECLMARYTFVAGKDWERVYGVPSGCSQMSYKSRSSTKKIVWNFPFNLAYRSTCPKGWPQITMTFVGPDFLGREIVKGYSTVHVPTQPGRHERTAYAFVPKSSSILVNIIGHLRGKVPELIDPARTLAEAYGREVVRADSGGSVKVVFNVSEKNMESFGYTIAKE